MCCSWRSHRAEPGQLSPSPPFSSSPSPLPLSMGLEDSPETAHRKSFPPGISTTEGAGLAAKEGATWGKAGRVRQGCRRSPRDSCGQARLSGAVGLEEDRNRS